MNILATQLSPHSRAIRVHLHTKFKHTILKSMRHALREKRPSAPWRVPAAVRLACRDWGAHPAMPLPPVVVPPAAVAPGTGARGSSTRMAASPGVCGGTTLARESPVAPAAAAHTRISAHHPC